CLRAQCRVCNIRFAFVTTLTPNSPDTLQNETEYQLIKQFYPIDKCVQLNVFASVDSILFPVAPVDVKNF
uniref:Uncharacterized protein n=1 Tax=Anopheles minimus TaxID=112268 RepID=A0A182WQA0_9DIPT